MYLSGSFMDNTDKKVSPIRPYRLLEFSKNETTSRHYWPDLIDRVANFITKYEADTELVWLFNSMNSAFHMATNDWLMLADVDDAEEKLVGHAVAQMQPYGRLGNVIFVHQMESDVYQDEIMQRGWNRICDWAVEKNIRYVMNYARTQAVARLYRQKYGFTDRRVLQTMDLLKRKD